MLNGRLSGFKLRLINEQYWNVLLKTKKLLQLRETSSAPSLKQVFALLAIGNLFAVMALQFNIGMISEGRMLFNNMLA